MASCHWYGSITNNSGALAARRVAKRSPILIWETKGNPWADFLMVIMASGIARGCVRTTTTTTTVESRKMAATLQIIGWQRHAALVYYVLHWYWTSMLWSIDTCQNKVSADQYHVTISQAQVNSSSSLRGFLKLTADQVLLFRLDRGPMSGKLVENRAGLFGRPVNAHPGLTFLLCKCFCFFFVYMVIIETQNRRPNNIQKTSA